MGRTRRYYSKKKTTSIPVSEKQIHKSLCLHARTAHPELIFFSDMSGLKTTIGTAMQMKLLRSSKSIPDLFVANPIGVYHGLFIEIKKDRDEIYKKDGKLRENEHILEQAAMLDRLSHLGFMAVFGCGLSDCIKILDDYLEGKN